MRIQVWLLVVGFIGVNCRQPGSTPSEVSSINSLKEKPGISLDPKLRRALLRVLNRLEMEDKATIPLTTDTELTDEEFLKIFGQPANSEDLGSLESKESNEDREEVEEEQDKVPDRPFSNQDFNYIPTDPEEKPTDSFEPFTTPANNEENEEPSSSAFAYLPTQVVEQPEQSLTDNQPTKPTPETDAIFFQLPTPIDIPDQVEEQKPEDQTEKEKTEEASTITIPLSPEFNINEERTKKDTNDTDVEIKSSILQDIKEGNETKPEKPLKHEVEFLPSSLIAAFTLQQDDKGNPKKVIPHNFDRDHPALVEKRQRELEEKEYLLQQQLRILQEEKFRVQGALQSKTISPSISPLSPSSTAAPLVNQVQTDSPFQDVQRQEELARQQELLRQQELQRQQDIQRHQEFLSQQELQRQQDAQRFNVHNSQRGFGSVVNNFEYNRQQEIQQQEIQRQRQQDFQRQEALRFQSIHQQNQRQQFSPVPSVAPGNQGFSQFPGPISPALLNINEQRNFVPNHRFQFSHQRKPFQEIEFQKSIDFRLPNVGVTNHQSFVGGNRLSPALSAPAPHFHSGIEHNRVNRHEPAHFVGNFGLFPQPTRQPINSILAQSGVSQFLPSDAKDDLNIVSKLLSFNRLPGERISEPSRIVEPPKF
ncbi:transcription activator MSS11-like [Cimex lectularius]|uniref:Uncharacterized protein n=1 Tax=Cimex lectularius TaxID=79782 RepID=A0A8I6S8P1_CIMLE|nr:transcription activator MSS11-like [Cimex lectularius]